MDSKKTTLVKGKENLKVLFDLIGAKTSNLKADEGKSLFSNLSRNLKDNIVGGIQDTSSRATEFIHSFKKDNLRNLEKALRVDKSQMIVSSKKNYIYKAGENKMIIVDRDMWGEPASVTIKESNNVTVKVIKYFEDKPFLFPMFNEKKIMGKVIHMNEKEIWYQDNMEVTVLVFKGEKTEAIKVKIDTVKNAPKKDLLTYVNNYKFLIQHKKLYDLAFSKKGIRVEDILRVRKYYIITKAIGNQVNVLLLDDEQELKEEFTLFRMPQLDNEAMDILLSEEILQYIRANNYQLENFKQSSNHIEYWQEIGNKQVCVMRYKV